MKNIFLNEKIILCVIFANALCIFAGEYLADVDIFDNVDVFFTLFYLTEMIVKHFHYGAGNYWSDGWNVFDGLLTIASLPSVYLFFASSSSASLSLVLTLRLLRLLRLFRVVHIFPGFSRMISGFRLAMSQSWSILLSFAFIVIIVGLFNCVLFRPYAPQYFGTPLTSIYSIFRLCTVEGWYEIPDAVAESLSPFCGSLVSLYFSLLLILGGIIGMSFINSVFVDAMVSDNNDALEAKVDELNAKIDHLTSLLDSKEQKD